MKETIFFTSLLVTAFYFSGCNIKQTSESDNSIMETQVTKQMSIEETMYERHGDYALFKTDHNLHGQQLWVVFLREEEMAIFIISNNLKKGIGSSLRYEYEIRGNKLRFYNGYERFDRHYPETSAEIFLDGDGVTFINMKQYGNRRNIHISANLSNESLSDQFLDYVRRYARM